MAYNPLDFNHDGKVRHMEYNYAKGDYSGDGEIYLKHGCGGVAGLYFGGGLCALALFGLIFTGAEFIATWGLMLVVGVFLIALVLISDASKEKKSQELVDSLTRPSPAAQEEALAPVVAPEAKKQYYEHRFMRAGGMPSIAEAKEALASKPAASGHKTLPDGTPVPVKEKPKRAVEPNAKDCRNCALWVSENPNAKRGWGCAVWYLMQDNPYAVTNSEGLADRFPDDGKVCKRFQMGTGKPCRCYDCAHWDREVFIAGRSAGCKIWGEVEERLDAHQRKIGSMYQFPRPGADDLVHKSDWICDRFKLAPAVPAGYGKYASDIAAKTAQKLVRTKTLFFPDDCFLGKRELWEDAYRRGFADMAIVTDGEGGAYLELGGQKAADIEADFARTLSKLDPQKRYAQITNVRADKSSSYLKRVWVSVSITDK